MMSNRQNDLVREHMSDIAGTSSSGSSEGDLVFDPADGKFKVVRSGNKPSQDAVSAVEIADDGFFAS
jgi:hypothetical protein